jgi:hypothetical protein
MLTKFSTYLVHVPLVAAVVVVGASVLDLQFRLDRLQHLFQDSRLYRLTAVSVSFPAQQGAATPRRARPGSAVHAQS